MLTTPFIEPRYRKSGTRPKASASKFPSYRPSGFMRKHIGVFEELTESRHRCSSNLHLSLTVRSREWPSRYRTGARDTESYIIEFTGG